MSNQLTAQVNTLIANWMVLYMKLHHFHWFIKGPHFFKLHEFYEKLYNEAAENIDELAERLLSIDKKPISTLKECLTQSTIEEVVSSDQGEEEMINETIRDLKKMVMEAKKGIEYAQENHDDVTADMLISMTKNLDKHIWMLQAFIK